LSALVTGQRNGQVNAHVGQKGTRVVVMDHGGDRSSRAFVSEASESKARFLAHYRLTGNVTAACELAGISRRQVVYEWREHDETFLNAFQEAGLEATDRLEEEARRRAHDGFEEPVFQGGKQVGTIRRYSDTLLVTLLKARAPERFRERVDVRRTATNDVPVDVLTPEQREKIRRIMIGEV
jgi:hypothetical protein